MMKTYLLSLIFSVLAITLNGCGGSSSADSESRTPIDDAPSATRQSQAIWLIGPADPIEIEFGQTRSLDLIVVETGSTVSSLSLIDAPDWISIRDNSRLIVEAPTDFTGGEIHTFTIKATLTVDDYNETISTTASVALANETIILQGNLPQSGGEIATDWRDVIIKSTVPLDASYDVTFSLVEKNIGVSSLELRLSPEPTDDDINRISFEHASHEELLLNYGRNTQFNQRNKATNRVASSPSGVDPDSQYTVPEACSNLSYPDENGDEHRLSHVWWGVRGYFVSNASFELFNIFEDGGEPRVLPSKENGLTRGFSSYFDTINLDSECAVALQSSISSKNEAGIGDRVPVLFIHGFDRTGVSAGTDGYFGKFPGMVESLTLGDRKFFPLIFRWQTNVRMEVVADELHTALSFIYANTEKKVHIVAHSFGGVLVRTMLQGIAMESEGSAQSKARLEKLIASVTTVGSPHSGVFHNPETVNHDGNSWSFNRGFAYSFSALASRLCDAVTCHQLGSEYTPFVVSILDEDEETQALLEDSIGMSQLVKGDLALKLAASYPASYPDIETQVLVGARVHQKGDFAIGFDTGDYEVKEDDLLISSYGQLWKAQVPQGLRQGIDGRNVSEHYLGNNYVFESQFTKGMFDDTFQPQEWVADFVGHDGGYVHMTGSADEDNYSEVGLESCTRGNIPGCKSATWHYFVDILKNTDQLLNDPVEQELLTVVGRAKSESYSVANINIELSYPNGLGVSTQTDADGNFSIDLPFQPNSVITLLFNPIRNTTDSPLRAVSMELSTFASVDQTSGDIGVVQLFDENVLSGTILLSATDSSSGTTLNEFNYEIISQSGVSTSSGFSSEQFTAEAQLPYGSYTIQISRSGYNAVEFYECEHFSALTECSPTLDPTGFVASGGMSVVLSWGLNPSDLDSHLFKLDANNVEQYHIYFGDKTNDLDSLDLDDVTSYGPETVRIQTVDPSSTYLYAVHHYAGTGSITGSSSAQVKVSLDNASSRVFTPPTGESSNLGSYWKVFEIRDGAIFPCNSNCIVENVGNLTARSTSSTISDSVIQRGLRKVHRKTKNAFH